MYQKLFTFGTLLLGFLHHFFSLTGEIYPSLFDEPMLARFFKKRLLGGLTTLVFVNNLMGDFLRGEGDLTVVVTFLCFSGETLVGVVFADFLSGDFCFFSTIKGNSSKSSLLGSITWAAKALLRTGDAFFVTSIESTGSGASLIESFC